MKLRVDKMGPGVQQGVFFWEEGPEGARKKVVKSLSLEDEFDVDDQIGHEIIAKYKEVFKVVAYGDGKKVASAPRNTMVKEEKTKDVT